MQVRSLPSLSLAVLPDADEPTPSGGTLRKVLATPKMRETMLGATVILGFDVYAPDNTYLFYGKEALERLVAAGSLDRLEFMKVAVDFFTDDPEVLSSYCVALKGSCCYRWSIPIQEPSPPERSAV